MAWRIGERLARQRGCCRNDSIRPPLGSESEQREALLSLIRFRSTAGDQLVSLADYIGRMKPGQESIFYITGDNIEALKKSPQLGGFAARGGEVLLLTDPIDEFWIPAIGSRSNR